ncbi:MAG TPA: hypothetical protein VFI95_25735 [Terriglobales bacterium]|nr:hypothetical protein [Terriglobales bacterium]
MAILIAACAILSSVEAVVPLFQYRRGRLRRAIPNLILAVGVVLTNVTFASMMASLSAFVDEKALNSLDKISQCVTQV